MQTNKRVCPLQHNGILSRGTHAYPGAYALAPSPPSPTPATEMKGMRRYLVRRLLNMIPTLLLVSLGAFAVVRWLPSDPARLLAGVDEGGAVDPALYAKIKKDLGFE